jgi:predicted DNA-binding protein with PD1-like motif
MSIASGSGQVFGGHVVHGNEIRTTVELLLLYLEDWELGRALDSETGYLELVHKPIVGE